MSRKYDNVIVFGPTGTVGGNVALEASKRGAKVWLAMRDPSKPIPDIPADVEKAGNFARVQADLTDPDSVGKAIKETGAKAAYLYLVHGGTDHMRGTLKAMRDGGVEYIVFLSSFSVKPGTDIRSITVEDFIPYTHAQVEIAVEEIGFPYFTALRPAVFASNFFKIYLDRSEKPPTGFAIYLDAYTDNIVPEDIGAVGGAVLVNRPADGKEVIPMYGPEVKRVDECWGIIKKVTGRDNIQTPFLTNEQFFERTSKSIPAPIARYLVKAQGRLRDREWYPASQFAEIAGNIKKYSGREPTKFEDYIEAHKAEWQAA